MDGLAWSEEELASLVEQLDKAASANGMESSVEKSKILTKNAQGITSEIKDQNKILEEVKPFKYLESIISDEDSKPEIIAAIGKLQTNWRDKNSSLRSWTLTAELQKRFWQQN